MSENKAVKQMIGKVFNNIADAIETGEFGKKTRIGLTTLGSEHGVENLVKAAQMAAKSSTGYQIVLIGPKVESDLVQYEANTEEEAHKKMEELLDSGEIDGCVTMHYSFPIGVSTVGKVITPGKGKEMFIATTTGTSSPHRTEAMVKNALYGIIAAKANGIKNPTVGILNVDGARQVEKALKELKANGYAINLTESMRSDGGCIMRGNDLLAGTPDIMVQDTLSGNVLMKVFSAFTTGGDYESIGYGYGPGIGEGQERTILILSRASGVPVVANALQYAAELVKGNLKEVAKEEFQAAKKANLDEILKSLTKDNKKAKEADEEITAPPKEVVTGSISGIDIMDLEDAVKALWKKGIYAESGMGCTGPILMVNEAKVKDALMLLQEAGFVAGEKSDC
ncbi:glycine/sarcosine/betaine reductase complex component C subunit alpha [Clostridium formicaceticum]|uniref:Glycine reductase n=1 Tax=Clostridium formicaceticum TaxID=1497 RepID=A0AAC9WH70_9CLOT|nr:glycine/sarcosine/betaine reductase complex component C subunit alpha [Clostridium formicaceticum]AOY77895.1 glycine reductase [Clostridium formicaceticum]ARE88514.1 Glycine/sarcosine/betaine reductase complex component C subunit alpha [Clostridium formicaceticum]